jgi:hypothetical protein
MYDSGELAELVGQEGATDADSRPGIEPRAAAPSAVPAEPFTPVENRLG